MRVLPTSASSTESPRKIEGADEKDDEDEEDADGMA